MKDLQLVDYYRILNPSKKVFTWRKRNPLKQGRLDYILISESLSNMVETISIKPGYRSDHSSVLLELKFNKFIRGRGLWKFNNSLLTDKTFIEKVKQTILKVQDQYLQDDDINHSIFLEVLLMEIRSITIYYSSFKKKEREKIEITLLKDIENIESQSDIDFGLLHEKKVELEKVRKEKLQGHIIRSRAKWVEEGEKPSKYFCSLESRNFLNKTIKKVETHNNNIIYDQCDILHQVKIFYESLFSCKDSDLLDINLEDIIKTDIPRLDTSTSISLEGDISESEIYNVLKNMKNNKSPGSDGFTVEFFKFFWKDFKHYIVSAVNHIFVKKELPISQRLGIITCLPKGDKPRQFLKNWHPITLLNVLYKLISGCLSYRIKSAVLNYLISETQSGFIKGRYIGENTRFVYDLLSFTETRNIPGLLECAYRF